MAALLLAAGAPAAAPAPPTKPQRILSLNMCNDLMLLMLVPKSRIASITYLAHDTVSVLMPGADKGVPINHGTAEDVVRARTHTGRALAHVLERGAKAA